jgi:hypothetical protein
MDQENGHQLNTLQEDKALKKARAEVKAKLNKLCDSPEVTNEVLNAAEAFCLLLLDLDE